MLCLKFFYLYKISGDKRGVFLYGGYGIYAIWYFWWKHTPLCSFDIKIWAYYVRRTDRRFTRIKYPKKYVNLPAYTYHHYTHKYLQSAIKHTKTQPFAPNDAYNNHNDTCCYQQPLYYRYIQSYNTSTTHYKPRRAILYYQTRRCASTRLNSQNKLN